MRSLAFVSAIFLSALALAQSGVISNEPAGEVAPYSIIDPIIKAILEGMKSKLANLKIDDINKEIKNPSLNATIAVKDILVKNADTFVIQNLKSTIAPLKLNNLTLTWKDITASAAYDVDAKVRLSEGQVPLRLFAKGNARVFLKDLFFTIGANIEMKNNAIQIKQKGLFGFDIRIGRANITLSSLLGSSDLGNTVGVFLSNAIPELVNVLKKPVFETFQDDIIKMVNQVLKKNGTTYTMDEYQEPEEIVPLDLSSEMDSFFGEPLNLPSLDFNNDDDDEFNFNF